MSEESNTVPSAPPPTSSDEAETGEPARPPTERLYPKLPMEVNTSKSEFGVSCVPANYEPKEARKEKKKKRKDKVKKEKKKKHSDSSSSSSSSSSDSDTDNELSAVVPMSDDQLMQVKNPKKAMAPQFMCQSVEGHLMSVEFYPLCTQKGNSRLEICPRFENFSNLMRQANYWLQANTSYRCLRCETVKRNCNWDGSIDFADAVLQGSKFGAVCYVRGLRMWVTQNQDSKPQQLWYVNVLPKAKPSTNSDPNNRYPEFEDLRTTLSWMNTQFGVNPIPGAILNMEQLELVFSQGWSNNKLVDLDKVQWLERQDKYRMFLIGLRVYYVIGNPQNEKIGVTSILPECMHRSGYQRPKFSEFDTLLKGAIRFIGQNLNVRITDLQTFKICVNREGGDLKWKDWNDEEDAYRSYCYDNSAYKTAFLVNTLRIIYTTGGKHAQFLNSGLLTTKVFMPYKVGDRTYETVQQSLGRVTNWMNLTRPRIVSAETLSVFHNPEMDVVKFDSSDVMLTKMTNHRYLTCFRFYIDGIVDEPNPKSIAPPPIRQQSSCCTVL